MHEHSLDRRSMLASIPALLAAPAALAQVPPGGAPSGARPRVKPAGSQDGITMPFAMAACWAEDFGALGDIRLNARLDCTIGVRMSRQPASDDESCAMLLSAGAAIECCSMLASASMAGSVLLYAPPRESGDLVQVAVRIGQVRKGSNPDAVRSAGGIFARPDPRGPFDPAFTPPASLLDKLRQAMIEQNCASIMVKPEAKPEFLRALRALAKASPVIAKVVGAPELWEDGCTPVLVGRGPISSLQSAITLGRMMQRAVLFGFQDNVSIDLRILLPGVLEAAAVQSAEATAASSVLAAMLEAPGFEPLAVGRLGRLVTPMPRATPPFMRILEPSLDREEPRGAPVAPPPA